MVKVKRLRKIAIGFMQVQILPAVFLCAATSLIVLGSTATLIVTAPFMPDEQEEAFKKVALDFSTPLLGGAIWLLGALVICERLEELELEEKMDELEQRYLQAQQQTEAPVPLPPLTSLEEQQNETPCANCYYYISEASSMALYFKHPCAVHPDGRPGENCADWRKP